MTADVHESIGIGFNHYVTFNRKEHNFLSQHNLIYLLKMTSIYEFPSLQTGNDIAND